MTIGSIVLVMGSAVPSVLYPQMLERYGASKDPHASEPLVYPPSLLLSYILTAACALLVVAVPMAVNFVLIQYAPGLNVIILLIFAVYPLAVSLTCGSFLVSTNREAWILVLQGVGIVLGAGLDYLFVVSGWGLIGVALGTLLANFFYGGSIIYLALRQLGLARDLALHRLFQILSPLLAVVACYAGSIFLLGHDFWFQNGGTAIMIVKLLVVCTALGILALACFRNNFSDRNVQDSAALSRRSTG